jgi:hypothetical protein
VLVSRRADPDRGTDGGEAVGGGGCAEAVVPARRTVSILAGFREPVVWILLAIAFFTYISGKPVDGVLMVIVAVGLIWDASRRTRDGAARGGDVQADPAASPAAAADLAGTRPAWRTGGRRRLAVAALLACGAVYAGVMGSFIRYSWPATAGIIILGTIVVVIGWHGPLRHRQVSGRLPVAGTLAWAVLIVFGGLWELSALLLQPSITTDSYAHPTISTLTDPLLATSPGRALVLAAWLAVGWYLVER